MKASNPQSMRVETEKNPLISDEIPLKMKKPICKSWGFTLVDLLIGTGVGGLLMAALFSGAMAMQQCFSAAEDYGKGKIDQARLSDYLALDLRRALTVSPGTGKTIMTVTIPNYYDDSGKPRTPTISNYVASYGSPDVPITVTYSKIGSSIYRQESGDSPCEIAANVEDFQLSVQDLGKVVKTQISFAPRFRKVSSADSRTATTIFNTTLLRNKRKT